MLQQTQALEDRLLKLNAERNELEAESARMPTHTTGRTQQERRRRAEVEGRLEEINKECSSIRLQLRRLGVK
jgi:septal ring factor EnvC (AmiA/AmiB activator)